MIYGYATKSWPVIKGCDNSLPCAPRCWAKRQIYRLSWNPNTGVFHNGLVDQMNRWTGIIRLNEAHLEDPLRWRKPQIVAVAYHGDIGLATGIDLSRIFAVMAHSPQHTFLLLTKRPGTLFTYLVDEDTEDWIDDAATWLGMCHANLHGRRPLPNVWLGVSVSNQKEADERIPILLKTPAARRWVSIEPMLGAVNVRGYLMTGADPGRCRNCGKGHGFTRCPNYGGIAATHGECQTFKRQNFALDWVVCGGESGPYSRPINPAWARDLRYQCVSCYVPFWFKQWGDWAPWLPSDGIDYHDFDKGTQRVYRVGKKVAGNLLNGVCYNEFPR